MGTLLRQINTNSFKNVAAAANITTFVDIYCAYHAKMVANSVFTVISAHKTKIAYIAAQKGLRNFGYKRGEPIFQIWCGGKKGGGEPKFFQNPRGRTKALHTMHWHLDLGFQRRNTFL